MIRLISAPTSLGLRPPSAGRVPGCYKAPEALRKAGMFELFQEDGASDWGTVAPREYSEEVAPGRIRNQEQIISFSRSLSAKIYAAVTAGDAPLVIGGDCSVLIAAGLALKRAGRYGLVHLDGHTDFRHPGNSDMVASLAGEDLAAAVGMHWGSISNIDGLGAYFEPLDAAHAGCRDGDEHLKEVRAKLGLVLSASEIRKHGVANASKAMLARMEASAIDGFWLHLDLDILDPNVLPAIDSPDPGGLSTYELTSVLQKLAPKAVGAEVTIYDPDLDPTGEYARLVSGVVHRGLRRLHEDA
ncbi:MAG: arginase family protein [Nitrososphaerota archaeon]|nr:arginase family protein [Nitrososphaerota archaeon]MDG7026316.1 arginase family protein [Nitrososphaerota archaeon]